MKNTTTERITRVHLMTLATTLFVLLATGCKEKEHKVLADDGPFVTPPLSNQQCVVMLRPEFVSSLKHPHLTKDYGMWGIFKRSTPHWVVIEKDEGEFWIPQNAILFVQLGGEIVMAPEW